MARYKNAQWSLRGNDADPTVSHDNIQLALLMDIRDELQALNSLFRCGNFLEIPHTLKRISRNTAKPKPKGKSTNETR
jgi:hypothetical protein